MILLEAISMTPLQMLVTVLTTIGFGGVVLYLVQRSLPTRKDEVQADTMEQDSVEKMFKQGQLIYDKIVLEVEKQVAAKTQKLANILMNKDIEHMDEIENYKDRIRKRENDFEIAEKGYQLKLLDANRRVSELETRIIELEKRLLVYEKNS